MASIKAAAKASAGRKLSEEEVSWEPCLKTDDDREYIREFSSKHAAVRSGQVVFFGDSDIEYWPGVETSLGAINCGVGGSEAMHHAFYVSRFLNKYRPSLVVYCGGENDFPGRSPEETAQAAQFAVGKILAFGASVILFSPKYEPDTKELQQHYRKYCKLMSAWASTRGPKLAYVDSLEAFCPTPREPKASFFQSDGLHLNSDGYGTVWLPKLSKALNKIGSSCTSKPVLAFRKQVCRAVLVGRRYRWACPNCKVACNEPYLCENGDGCGCCDCDSNCEQKLRLQN